jgi:asparagine synthase (glutamine-hydrolysing)
MSARLARRGPDGVREWRDGSVALGHAHLVSTPEALHEVLPFREAATGCTITADARLDNRDELLDALGVSGAERGISDSGIILRAFLSWGEACLDRFLGDFTFAIWDPRRQRLFAARDQLGMRQLSYAHVPGRVLAFATEPRAVIEAPDIPRDLNEGRIADYLEDVLEAIDHEQTFYRAVLRLPPAHRLVVDQRGIEIRRYWSQEMPAPLALPSDEAYAEAFREVFAKAVRSRLRTAGAVGSMLSGGMDSGSVVAVASRLLAEAGRGPLPTFSVVGPDPANYDETLAIQASLTMPGLAPYLIDVADLTPWADDLWASLQEIAEPFDGHMNMHRAIYRAASNAGVRVVLDGGAGDVVLSQGNYLPALARSGRFAELWRELAAEEAQWGRYPRLWRWTMFQGIVRSGLVPDRLRVRLRRLLTRLRSGREGFRPGPLLSPEFAAEMDAAGRRDKWKRNNYPHPPVSSLGRAALVTGPMMVAGRERYDRVAGAFGVEPRDPFLDRRVIDFCLSCPASQMRWRGWRKVVLRRAMEGMLPQQVIWRHGYTHLGHSLTRELIGAGRFEPPDLSDLPDTRRLLFQRATGLATGQLSEAGLGEERSWPLWYLALWLRSEQERCQVS